MGIKNKRPVFIAALAILILLPVPADLFTVITLNKDKYKEDIQNSGTLINEGHIKYRNSTVNWINQSEFSKKRIINRLNYQKKIVENFFLYRTFKWFFIGSSVLLFYGLWNLKRWTLIIFVINILLAGVFNAIFAFFSFQLQAIFLVLDIGLLVLAVVCHKKYFRPLTPAVNTP